MPKMMRFESGVRIPMPKCVLCNRRYCQSFLRIFNGRLTVPICFLCLGPPDEVARCEQKIIEIFRNEPAFIIPQEKKT